MDQEEQIWRITKQFSLSETNELSNSNGIKYLYFISVVTHHAILFVNIKLITV